jgi:hypothetical protein
MEAFPIGVFELVGETLRGLGLAHFVQRIDQRIRADDPEHVEAPQRIHGHKALGGWGVCGGLDLG